MVGDHKTGTGPANVTKEYIDHLADRARCLKASSKAGRLAELFLKIPFSSVVFCSGYSAQNIIAAKIAHFFKIKCAYLMHGSVAHENRINLCEDQHMNRVEYETLKICDKVFAVSHRFAAWLKKRYPEFESKIDVLVNGVDADILNEAGGSAKSRERKRNMIFSIGGGMPRKRINRICEAMELLRKEDGYGDLELVVTGDKGAFSEIISGYDFVKDLGIVGRKEIQKLLNEAGLFIQNSCFETFALAPMEALSCGCDILLSMEIGALELFDLKGNRELSQYIIKDCEDPVEIKDKIKVSLGSGNAALFLKAFDKDGATWETRTEQLVQKLKSL